MAAGGGSGRGFCGDLGVSLKPSSSSTLLLFALAFCHLVLPPFTPPTSKNLSKFHFYEATKISGKEENKII